MDKKTCIAVECSACNGTDKAKTPTTYTIKPLWWSKLPKSANQWFRVHTPMGFYLVGESRWLFLRENYELTTPCTSIEDGKAQAEAHYREQLGKCLEVYDVS